MGKSILEIEKELTEAKNREKLVFLQKELDNLKTNYEGKAFGTHTFERKNRSSFTSASFYEKFWIDSMKIKMLRWTISIQRTGKNYEFSQDALNFSRQKSEISSQDNGYHAQYNLIGQGMGSYEKKNISIDKFMQLWEYGESASDKLNDVYSKVIQNDSQDILRVGSSNDEKILANAFDYLKLDFVDITENYKVFNALKYKHLPFLQEQKYLPRIYAKEILNYQILQWKKELSERWCSRKESLYEDIKIIEDFILTL